jgi:uncharacterized membrane protein
MTDQPSYQDQLEAQGWGAYRVIAVYFEDDRNAYNALTQLKELQSQHRIAIEEAVVVVREHNGQVVEQDRVAGVRLPNTIGGGLTGLLIGIIGGPLGMLIGSASGLFVGSLFDSADITDTETALGAISSAVQVGQTSLLAVVSEQSPEAIDAAMSDLGGTVLRRPVAEVEAEIAAAEKAERKAKREARKELARSHREHDRVAVEMKLNDLKTKLGRSQKTPA